MRIAIVSTWPPAKCGVAQYSRKLTIELQALDHEVKIFAERTKELIPARPGVVRNWTRLGPIPTGPILDFRPDVLQIEHEYGIFPNAQYLWRLIDDLTPIPVVITLHTVTAAPKHVGFYMGYRRAHFIAHSPAAVAILSSRGDWPAHFVHHGCSIQERLPRQEALAKLRLPDRPMVLCAGFMAPSKGHREIIEGFAQARERTPMTLVIVGECRDGAHYTMIDNLIKEYSLDADVVVNASFQADLLPYLSAASFVVLGNWKGSPYSASGQLHDALGLGLPVLAKNAPIYQFGGEGVLLYSDPTELAALMVALAKRPDLREHLSQSALTEARVRSWQAVAKRHIEVYEQCRNTSSAKS